jgi:arylsulfatase A-like enzyme
VSSIEWVGNQEQPWFLWLAYTAPHPPFHLPPAELHTRHDLSGDYSDISLNPLPYYLAMLEALDSELGRLLSSLPAE